MLKRISSLFFIVLSFTFANAQNTITDFNQQTTVNSIINNIVNNMVLVEGGSFIMGATSDQGTYGYNDALPIHKVTLSTFKIGKYEVTQKEWNSIMGYNPSNIKGDDLPVESISWNECQMFLRKINSLTGLKFRLPTEAEWEFAARGGVKSRKYKYSGGNNINDIAWYGKDFYNGHPQPVGKKKTNELGIFDMSGNVSEWCQDWSGDYTSSSQINPQGPNKGERKIYRGGDYSCIARGCRVSLRCSNSTNDRYRSIGFRIVLDGEIHNLPQNKPIIEWDNLPSIVYKPNISLIIKIKSDSKIERENVCVNGSTRGIISVVNDGANFLIKKDITLREGQNTISVEVSNATGTSSESKIVDYVIRRENPIPQPNPINLITQKRLALVIGNADYQYVDKLNKTANDAYDIANKLRQFGFEVIEKENLSQIEFNRTISDFGNKSSSYDVSLFYYAGHAIECDGINYLIPTDAKVEEKVDLMSKCVNANFILESLQNAKSKTNIIVLDACRDNPFKAAWARSRGASSGGLAHMEGSDGTYFMFATSPGKEAYDGTKRNSPFTSAFLTSLDNNSDMPLELFAKQVVRLTMQNSNSTQRPWIAGSLIGDFYFKQK